MTHPDIIKTCKLFGCTVDQARAQYKANALQMRANEDKALKAGAKVRGYTAAQWADKALQFEQVAS